MSQESRLQMKRGRPLKCKVERSSSASSSSRPLFNFSIKLQLMFCFLVAVSLITILGTNSQLEGYTSASISDPFFGPPKVPAYTTYTSRHSNTNINNTSSLLKVPFYVYENENETEFNLNWYNNAIWNGTVISQSPEYHKYKHSDDYWMLEHALHHPMRTRDPSRAKLFFVPILLNILAREVTFSNHDFERNLPVCSSTNSLCGIELLRQADEILGKSPRFQRFQKERPRFGSLTLYGQEKESYVV
jgi:hypothetical protein